MNEEEYIRKTLEQQDTQIKFIIDTLELVTHRITALEKYFYNINVGKNSMINDSGLPTEEEYLEWLAEKKAKLDNFLAEMEVEQKGKDDERI